MKRIKRHKVKTEAPETSTSYNKEQEVHDLAYYIHDRVELMHQVFSVIKYKELKAMLPGCIRNISLSDLQELCTEELLGISSKRLCAILDGAEPPSDTESSSPSPPPEQMETISLDSISSDDEILSQASGKKKKHKHRRHSKSKAKRKKSKEGDEEEAERSKASRAGLTVLELLELQARARAIRAQLQQEQRKPCSDPPPPEPPHSSDNEVEIKEEPAEVVEISSEDEKPSLGELNKIAAVQEPVTSQQTPAQATVTKRINDLVITVPQTSNQKIKLKRNKSIKTTDKNTSVTTNEKAKVTPSIANTQITKDKPTTTENKIDDKTTKKDKPKKKKKDKKNVSKDDIDNDEITLQLSDTEKMDLLEDLDRKHYDSVSSESSSESSSDSDASEIEKNSSLKDIEEEMSEKEKDSEGDVIKVADKETLEADKVSLDTDKVVLEAEKGTLGADKVDSVAEEITERTDKESEADINKEKEDPVLVTEESTKNSSDTVTIEDKQEEETDCDKTVENKSNSDKISSDETVENKSNSDRGSSDETVENKSNSDIIETESLIVEKTDSDTNLKDTVTEKIDVVMKDTPSASTKEKEDKNMSEGELSDRESSDVEAVDLKPEVVCISDEEGNKKPKKKKKKKDKKSKKEKKSKKKSDFRESADQNFYKESNSSQENIENCDSVQVIDNSSQKERIKQDFIVIIDNSQSDILQGSTINKSIDEAPTETTDNVNQTTAVHNAKEVLTDKIDLTAEITIDEDIKPIVEGLPIDKTRSESPGALSDSDIEAVYEIMELSDDSSCCETECTTILSKEPTASEIEALSAKIDEIEREEIITDKEIRDYEREQEKEREIEAIGNISWKDRYLDSKKVKKVLTTANILNALRKKNIELKKKLADSKKEPEITVKDKEEEPQSKIEEGTIELYNTLQPLTTYVNPVQEITKDLKKDAILLLKMYKKLLKYNDINKTKDPSKKRKKKKKDKKKVTKHFVKDTESGDNEVRREIIDVSGVIGEELQSKEIESNTQEELVHK